VHLEKVVTKKRSLHVIEQLVRMIKEGGVAVGDKLPPERVITEKTGVSRSSVREALAMLQASGVIEVKVGDGVYVRSTSMESLDVPPPRQSPADVLELRMCLESKVAALAAERRSSAALAELEKLVARMDKVVSAKDEEGFKQTDQVFHTTIAAATGNAAIEHQVQTLVAHLYQPIWLMLQKIYFSGDDLGGIADSLKEHERIVRAIGIRDPESAGRAMWEHLGRVRMRLIGEHDQRT